MNGDFIKNKINAFTNIIEYLLLRIDYSLVLEMITCVKKKCFIRQSISFYRASCFLDNQDEDVERKIYMQFVVSCCKYRFDDVSIRLSIVKIRIPLLSLTTEYYTMTCIIFHKIVFLSISKYFPLISLF